MSTEVRRLALIIKKQGQVIAAQAEELTRYKEAVAADVKSIKSRLDVVEAISPAPDS